MHTNAFFYFHCTSDSKRTKGNLNLCFMRTRIHLEPVGVTLSRCQQQTKYETRNKYFGMRASATSKTGMSRSSKIKRTRGRLTRDRDTNPWKFDTHIRHINRVINGNMPIREDAMRTINGLLWRFMERICENAKLICQCTGRKTLYAKDLSKALKLMIGDTALYRHGHSEGRKAMTSLALSYAKK